MEAGFQRWLQGIGVQLDVIPRDSHNQLPLAERHVGIIKDIMTKMAEDSEDRVSPKELFTLALDAANELGKYAGHSPYELMFGRVPHAEVGDVLSEAGN
eukprot:4579644-Alexandrium_andersonii.AAC.1